MRSILLSKWKTHIWQLLIKCYLWGLGIDLFYSQSDHPLVDTILIQCILFSLFEWQLKTNVQTHKSNGFGNHAPMNQIAWIDLNWSVCPSSIIRLWNLVEMKTISEMCQFLYAFHFNVEPWQPKNRMPYSIHPDAFRYFCFFPNYLFLISYGFNNLWKSIYLLELSEIALECLNKNVNVCQQEEWFVAWGWMKWARQW